MGAWKLLIWTFFPIPLFCLALMSLTWPPRLEERGTALVGKIFLTKIPAGPRGLYVRVLWLFSAISIMVFIGSVQYLNNIDSVTCPTCKYHGENLWYGRAMRFRAERNFWLSLFNAILWFLVSTVYRLRRKTIKLRARVAELEEVVMAGDGGGGLSSTKAEDGVPGEGGSKKDD